MPTRNCFVESFNGKFRDECLNASWFVSLADAYQAISSWRRDYDRARPHGSLGDLTPEEFSATATPSGKALAGNSSTQIAAPASEAASDRGL